MKAGSNVAQALSLPPRHWCRGPARRDESRRGIYECLRHAIALCLAATGFAQQRHDVRAHYQKAEYMVPMRDGIRLHTSVYTPRKSSEKLPFLLFRTPYGTGPYGPTAYRSHLGPSPHSFEFEEEGFIFVFQDVRGKF